MKKKTPQYIFVKLKPLFQVQTTTKTLKID